LSDTLYIFDKEPMEPGDGLSVHDMSTDPAQQGGALQFSTAYEGQVLSRAEVEALHAAIGQWLHDTLGSGENGKRGEYGAITLRHGLRVIRDFAKRTMPHADGQGHLALMGIASMCERALSGETIR
jgi:hypothetical protein